MTKPMKSLFAVYRDGDDLPDDPDAPKYPLERPGETITMITLVNGNQLKVDPEFTTAHLTINGVWTYSAGVAYFYPMAVIMEVKFSVTKPEPYDSLINLE